MNILIKLTCLIGLVIAPILGGHTSGSDESMNTMNVWIDEDGNKHELDGDSEMFFSDEEGEMNKEVKVEMSKEGDLTVATIETIKMVDGKKSKSVQKIKGTEEEVKAMLDKMKNEEINEENDMDGAKINKEVKVNIEENEDGTSKATVITTTTENGESKTEEQVFNGTMDEIKSKIKEFENVDVKVEDGKKVIIKEIEEVIEN